MMKEHNYYFTIIITGISLSVLFMLTSFLSGFGTKSNFWNYHIGLKIFRWSVYGEFFAILIIAAGLIINKNNNTQNTVILSVIGILISTIIIIIGIKWYLSVKRVPYIHDITTDIKNPPLFNKILKLRKDTENPTEYAGETISGKQIEAYPEIKPLEYPLSPDDSFDLCLKTAKDLKWKIINSDKENRIIEAVDETFWFGFKDDIIIRISASNKFSRIDIRSLSRVGKSDVGTNAKRILKFINILKSGSRE